MAETVLLAEDEAPVRRLARKILERQGYRILEAEDGLAALRVAEAAEAIDLLVTDLSMPGLDGRALALRLRQTIPALRVLFLSGYAREDVGGDPSEGSYLSKPFTPAELVARVQEVLQG